MVGVLKFHNWSASGLKHPVVAWKIMSEEKVFSYFTSLTYFVLVPHELEIHWVEEYLSKWNREYDSFIFLFFQMLFLVKTSKTLHIGLFRTVFETSMMLLLQHICVHRCSSPMNYLPTQRTVEKIFLRGGGLEWSPTKLPRGITRMPPWTNSPMQSNFLRSLNYKIKLPFLLSLYPFQALFSLFFSQKGRETAGKISCSSKSNDISTLSLEQASLGVRPALFP